MTVTIKVLMGEDVLAAIDDLGRLRMTVFAEWPYLYDGDPAYEAHYLHEFASTPDGILVAACDENRIVGAATASPMHGQKAEFRAPFETRGLDVSKVFYFGESVLLPEYRGQGIGHAFFDHREAQASKCGAKITTFAAVVRPLDHPDRPTNYRPIDAFWHKRGYAPVKGFVTEFEWKDHRDEGETVKTMQYWVREA